MRWYIIRALLYKEYLRHLANRGGLLLQVILIAAAMLLSFFTPSDRPGTGLTSGVGLCYIDYSHNSPFLRHLRQNVPDGLANHIRFRHISEAPTDSEGKLIYPQNTGAIQLRSSSALPNAQVKDVQAKDAQAKDAAVKQGVQVWFWHPGTDPGQLAPYEVWFWREVARFNQSQDQTQAQTQAQTSHARQAKERTIAVTGVPESSDYFSLAGGLDPRSGLATALVMFGVFLLCVYLQPSLTCEERERGLLLAQALSPASPTEILLSKFLFYPFFALLLGGLLAGTYRPGVLLLPFFWLSLSMITITALGIGMTISTLARTQRAASMGALVYMLSIALFMFICQQNNIPGLPFLTLEYHAPRILHASLTNTIYWYHWGNLVGAGVLAIAWVTVAIVLFRRYGWQN